MGYGSEENVDPEYIIWGYQATTWSHWESSLTH